MTPDLNILTKTYDLILWTCGHTQKFSRSHRFSLGQRLEERLYALLDDLIEAKYTKRKVGVLRQAALKVEQIRYQFRLAKDLRLLPMKSHGHAIKLLDDVGRQLGGWRRQSNQRESPEGVS